ncbi:hypothetical protein FJTKL_15570 [Diaporthe vaccinii]|uniref:Replication factor A protein 3 n=1 Tax=Diaporthe vaccinii TaxID=105482 RepID=A0ABR4F730_9PEZI
MLYLHLDSNLDTRRAARDSHVPTCPPDQNPNTCIHQGLRSVAISSFSPGMESQPTPRITAPYLDSYQGRNVIVVGRVIQLRGEAAVIDSDGNITAHLNREAHLSNGNAVQIIGKVNPDLSIRVLSSLDLGAGVGTFLPDRATHAAHAALI